MNRPTPSAFRLLFRVAAFFILLSSCSPADPALVARAVNATLTAAVSPTPIIVVITVERPVPVIPPETATPPATLTLAPTATATPTPIPTDTPTLAASPTLPFAVGDFIWHDDFTDPGQWYPTDDVAQRTEVKGGQLFITLKLAERFALTYNNATRAQDFYAAVTGRAAVCATRDRYGLLFRVQDGSNYYLLDVDCDGRYRVTKMVNDERTLLQDWMASADLYPASQPNTLGVRAQGNTFEIFINQKSQASLTDEGFADGGFGLYAGSGAASLNFTASFDDLHVWKLK